MGKELTNKVKKAPLAQKKKKITATDTSDMFTRLCQSQFGVECVKEYRFYQPRRWRYDYAIPKYKIAIEVEGGVWTQGRHTRPKGFLGDVEKYNTGTLLGWRIFRTTPQKLLSGSTLLLIKNAILGTSVPVKDVFLQEK